MEQAMQATLEMNEKATENVAGRATKNVTARATENAADTTTDRVADTTTKNVADTTAANVIAVRILVPEEYQPSPLEGGSVDDDPDGQRVLQLVCAYHQLTVEQLQ